MIWIRHTLVALMAMLMAGIVLTVLGIGVLTVMLQSGPVELPQLQRFVETRLNSQIDKQDLRIGGISVLSGDEGVANKVRMTDVAVFDPTGEQLLSVPEVQTSFSLLELVKGQVAPTEISIVGTDLSLERRADGSFSLFGAGAQGQSQPDVLALIDVLNTTDGLQALSKVHLEDTKVTFRDASTGRSWVLDNSALTITRQGDLLSGRAVLAMEDVDTQDGVEATIILNADYTLGSDTASVSFQFANANPAEIANMFQAFDWLRNLDTRASGSVRADLDGTGRLGNLHGVLELSDGALRESPASQKIAFSEAKVYFEYDAEADTLNMSEVDVKTSSGSVTASGYAELQRDGRGAVAAMAGQLRVSRLTVRQPDVFDTDIELDAAALDARVSFEPLRIDVGRLTVFDQGATYRLSGHSEAGKDYWSNRYDIDVDRLDYGRLMQLWPRIAVPKTRAWLAKNVHAGRATDFAGGMRSEGGKFEYAFNFGIEDASFDFLRTVPPLRAGRGFGYLTHQDLRLNLSSGHVIAPDGTAVDVAGTSLFIPDIHARPTPGEITLHAKGGVEAALGLLDSERFRFLQKAGLKPDVADGAVVVTGSINVPLEKKAKLSDVQMALRAELLNVSSHRLVEGRQLTAQKMVADITQDGVTLSGPARLDAVPLQATWVQSFDKEEAKTSTVVAKVQLDDKNLRQFGVDLPKGTVRGAASARVEVTLQKGEKPAFEITSGLVGAGLRIPQLGWSKGAKTKGRFVLTGRFGQVVDVDRVFLQAAGLTAEGTLELKSGGALGRARFSRVQVGKWLDTSAVLTPTGRNSSTISLSGGSVDLRFWGTGQGGGSNGSSGGGNTTLKLILDRVRVTNDLSLTSFSGNMTTRGGLRGKFVGRVNGGARVDGQLFPQSQGTAIELTSKDAGGVMASARLLENARGGDMRMVLVPRKGTGNYDGTLEIKRTRLKDASAMAALLNGISLVGLLQQLEGPGIHFNTVSGQFKLRANGVKLENISAVGPSIGMTLGGWYDIKRKSVDFEGVITPLYAVNGMFERLFGPLMGRRKGEGMFSFTYRMRGPASKPRVAVNPLSILTPGAFREIFRTRPPKAPTQ